MHEGPSHPSTAQKAGSPEHGTVFRLSAGVRAHPDGVDNILVVIPTYNEAETIDLALDSVLALDNPEAHYDVLVVDDNSPDGTADLVDWRADDRLHVLRRPGKAGLGAAYRAGFTWGIGRSYDVIVQMDADGSHPADRIPALLAAISSGADLAIGSRYVPGGRTANWTRSRRLISWGGNTYARLVLALGVHDATAGFRAWTPRALGVAGVLTSESNGYSFQVENTWHAVRRGLRITEVPITFTDRAAGTSKMDSSIVREAVLRVLLWRWREITRTAEVPRAA